MKKCVTLLWLAMMAIIGIHSPALGAESAKEMEPTDSGAPSAIMIFPVTAKPNPGAVGMAPVTFNHLIHEKWMEREKKDCIVCHHTGDPVACTVCHTVEGSKDANFVTLHRAMHAPKITVKTENSPSSCVSCHSNQVKNRECAGCHTRLVSESARKKTSWCVVCHTVTPEMTKNQMELGIQGKLPEMTNEKLAEATALARKQVQYWSPMVAPYKVSINTLQGPKPLQNDYQPCLFNHRHHVISLLDRIKDNKLAGAFHTQQATLCMTCHHRTPASALPPKCVDCHSITVSSTSSNKPNLKAAFHLQCMSCHTDMQVARPRDTDCLTCHKLRPVQGAGN